MQPEPLDFATAEQVWDRLRETVRPGRTQRVSLNGPELDLTGAVLAEDVNCLHPFPPFARAVMDGYAVRTSDFTTDTVTLRNTGLVKAGEANQTEVTPGTCQRINTGAPLPPGADAVVIVEKSQPGRDDTVQLTDAPKPRQHVEPAGKHRQINDLLARAGTRLHGASVAALVAGAVQEAVVFPRPSVAVLTTGDELRVAGEALGPGQIHDTNRLLLGGLTQVDEFLGRAPDEMDALQAQLRQGLKRDLLVVVGGMSKGSHDLVPAALEELGVQWLVTSLNLKPGKPTRIGQIDKTWVIGVPGNPVSAAVCFLLFAQVIQRGLQGQPVEPPPVMSGTLTSDMPACGPRPMYQPGQWHTDHTGAVRINPLQWAGSGDPFGMTTANALIRRPGNAPAAPRGEAALFHPIGLP